MSSEVQVRNPGTTPVVQNTPSVTLRAHTHLKTSEYLLAMFALGLATNPQRARLIHMADKTVASALEGNPISGEFIANLLEALQPHQEKLTRVQLTVSFGTFFETKQEQTNV